MISFLGYLSLYNKFYNKKTFPKGRFCKVRLGFKIKFNSSDIKIKNLIVNFNIPSAAKLYFYFEEYSPPRQLFHHPQERRN